MTPPFRTAIVLICTLLVLGSALRAQNAPHQTQEKPGHDHLSHRFEKAEEWARRFDDPARDGWQMPSRVIEALRIQPGQVVADIGAGTGYFTVRLAKAPPHPKVYAVDIEASMVEYVRTRAQKEGLRNIVAIRAAPDSPSLPEPVDRILIVDTYHHIPNRIAYFTALKKMMKPGAELAVIDFRKGAPEGPPEEFRFTPEQIATELSKAGYALQRTYDFLPRQIFLIFAAS